MNAATYILPVRLADASPIPELAEYVRGLDGVEAIVVDGSSPQLFAALHDALRGVARHVRPNLHSGRNGKACGVLTGLQLATTSRIVVADDDVRYDRANLREVLALLDEAEVVRPQNFFDPAPWHAILDGSRSLINRALDGDWPGTLAFRRAALPDGYNADVLFENFELVQTIRARGGRELVARSVFVARRPPATSHFFSQRVRQAYDEFARPVRLGIALAVLPGLLAALLLRRFDVVAATAATTTALALYGWLRGGAFAHFSFLCVLAAPVWMLERALCAWLAVYQRVRFGGVRYGDVVIPAAASKARVRGWAS